MYLSQSPLLFLTADYVKDVDYNAAGQITHIKYGNDVTSDYTYDGDTLRLTDILTEKSGGNDLQELSYTFDGNGNVLTIGDTVNSMSQTFTYDDLNRLKQAEGSAYGGSSDPQTFTYDAIGNMTNKDGQVMSYGAGSAGPHAVTSITGTVRPTYCPKLVADCTFTYDANGNMTKRGVDDLTYDSENRLKQIDVRAGSEDTHSYNLVTGWNAVSFPYLPADRAVENVLSELTFKADGTGDYSQISYWDPSAGASGEWKHYVGDSDFNDFDQLEHGRTYEIYVDSATNMPFDVTGSSPAVDLTHNIVSGDNFISPVVTSTTAVATILSGVTYTDVKVFNTTTDVWDGGVTNFEVGKGYIITATGTDSFDYGGASPTTTTFVYDSTGARVKKTIGSTTTTYLGKDYDKTGADTTKYIFLGDRRIATRKNSDTAEYIHSDHINSSNVITDSNGDRVGYHEFDPYGSTVVANPDTGDTADPKHKFTGQEEDNSAKLYNYNARLYDPQLGRFITADWIVQDPSDPQTLNRYAYARNNPIKFIDPTGNSFFSKLLGVFVAVGVFILTGGNTALAIAAFAAVDSFVSSVEQGASFGKALLRGSISFAVSYAAGQIAAPLAGSLGSTLGSAASNVVKSALSKAAGTAFANYAGQLAAMSMQGAIQGALQGGLGAGIETTLYGGSLKEIGSSAFRGVYTGAIYGAILNPVGKIVGDGASAAGKQFNNLLRKLGLASPNTSVRGGDFSLQNGGSGGRLSRMAEQLNQSLDKNLSRKKSELFEAYRKRIRQAKELAGQNMKIARFIAETDEGVLPDNFSRGGVLTSEVIRSIAKSFGA